jgi:rod shape-determining protein MreC
MVVQNNYQKATFLNYTGLLSGSVFSTYNRISDYFSLKKANDALALENAQLKTRLNLSETIYDTCQYRDVDTLYRYFHAKVISSSIGKQKNFIMLNKGRAHGIKKDMGVISHSGMVGTVVDVSENFSRVMPAINTSYKINARILKNQHIGNIEWDGYDYKTCLLTDVPSHVFLAEGDTIVTSGNSFIFPEGILIGVVENTINQEGEKFIKAKVRFSVDFNNLYYVYVIHNLNREEQLRLNSANYRNE